MLDLTILFKVDASVENGTVFRTEVFGNKEFQFRYFMANGHIHKLVVIFCICIFGEIFVFYTFGLCFYLKLSEAVSYHIKIMSELKFLKKKVLICQFW